MNLTDTIAKYVLGVLPADQLPNVAMDAMEAGRDSPSLRQLAGSQGCDSDVISKLFARAVDALGEHMPSAPEAGLLLAKMIARDVLDGLILPYEGAKRIWEWST